MFQASDLRIRALQVSDSVSVLLNQRLVLCLELRLHLLNGHARYFCRSYFFQLGIWISWCQLRSALKRLMDPEELVLKAWKVVVKLLNRNLGTITHTRMCTSSCSRWWDTCNAAANRSRIILSAVFKLLKKVHLVQDSGFKLINLLFLARISQNSR